MGPTQKRRTPSERSMFAVDQLLKVGLFRAFENVESDFRFYGLGDLIDFQPGDGAFNFRRPIARIELSKIAPLGSGDGID